MTIPDETLRDIIAIHCRAAAQSNVAKTERVLMAEELLAARRLIEAQSFVNHHFGDDELPPRAIQELMGAAKAYEQLTHKGEV